MGERKIMTVREAVAELLKLPQDFPLLVEGYEIGMADAKAPELVHAVFDQNHGLMLGPHDRIFGAEPNAVFIGHQQNHLKD